MINYIIGAVIVAILGFSIWKIIKDKKNGSKCAGCPGCPYAGSCSGNCASQNLT